jgi:hypothetical protein
MGLGAHAAAGFFAAAAGAQNSLAARWGKKWGRGNPRIWVLAYRPPCPRVGPPLPPDFSSSRARPHFWTYLAAPLPSPMNTPIINKPLIGKWGYWGRHHDPARDTAAAATPWGPNPGKRTLAAAFPPIRAKGPIRLMGLPRARIFFMNLIGTSNSLGMG